jgi:hypothetical protein
MADDNQDSEIEEYGDPGILSAHAPVPRWLTYNYIFWILWGIVAFGLYWNGSHGWLDRGYWQQLQRAANTTYPFNTNQLVERQTPEVALQKEETKG